MASGSMRAALVKNFGRAREVIAIVDDRKIPEPRSGEVLVNVAAASINPIEVRRRSGYARTMMKRQGAAGFPMILGLDYAGVVAKAGGGFKKGDKVYGVKPHSITGTNAEYCAVPAKFALRAPSNVELDQLASFPYAFLTVWSALVGGAGLVPGKAQGKRVFVQGGAGGTGTLAIQLCKAWGATVATSCSTKGVELCRSLGADQVIDYTKEDYTQILSDFDVALCLADLAEEERMLQTLKPNAGAAFVSIVHPIASLVDERGALRGLATAFLRLRAAKARARAQGKKYAWAIASPNRAALGELNRLVASGAMRPVIDRTFALDDIVEAHEYVETGRAKGKVMLSIAQGVGT
ncbi:MAG: zinc-binding dehydrogenase [Alphaproteobacteria bacterium]|nr:zinc-binding dehydrogenase [Alphaproteobacteria bacterium]